MKLEHTNFNVKSLDDTLAFYQLAFPDCFVRAKGSSAWGDLPYSWIHFGDDFNFLTFNEFEQDIREISKPVSVGINHFGFEVEGIESLRERLLEAGYVQSGEGASNEFRKNVYFYDPNGLEVEFVEYFSDSAVERNS